MNRVLQILWWIDKLTELYAISWVVFESSACLISFFYWSFTEMLRFLCFLRRKRGFLNYLSRFARFVHNFYEILRQFTGLFEANNMLHEFEALISFLCTVSECLCFFVQFLVTFEACLCMWTTAEFIWIFCAVFVCPFCDYGRRDLLRFMCFFVWLSRA
jgi:hypothetical protein